MRGEEEKECTFVAPLPFGALLIFVTLICCRLFTSTPTTQPQSPSHPSPPPPPQVRDYVKEFHPRMVGLTGPPERTTAAAKAYRVYFSRTQDSEDDYLIDHSIITYLINPEVCVWGWERGG